MRRAFAFALVASTVASTIAVACGGSTSDDGLSSPTTGTGGGSPSGGSSSGGSGGAGGDATGGTSDANAGTTSTGGSATAGTGGATSSGGTTAAGGQATAMACEQCALDQCKSESVACYQDPSCMPCLTANPDPSCIANPSFQAFSNCVCQSCASQCPNARCQGLACVECATGACPDQFQACASDKACAVCFGQTPPPECMKNDKAIALVQCTCAACGQSDCTQQCSM